MAPLEGPPLLFSSAVGGRDSGMQCASGQVTCPRPQVERALAGWTPRNIKDQTPLEEELS